VRLGNSPLKTIVQKRRRAGQWHLNRASEKSLVTIYRLASWIDSLPPSQGRYSMKKTILALLLLASGVATAAAQTFRLFHSTKPG
jgi:hypothetical protein